MSSDGQSHVDPEEKRLSVNGFALGILQPIGPN